MAFGTGHIVTGDYSNFLPEMWSDEVIGAYKSNLVVANHVTRINHAGKKGSVIHIPKPTRGAANLKVAEGIVTFNNPASSEVALTINKHYEYSFLYEDLVSLQALDSLRRFYTDDAGYALAKQVDTDLVNLWEGLQGGTVGANTWAKAVVGADGSTLYNQAANTNTGNGSALADAGIRKMIQTLDDADVPLMGRVMIIPPVEKNVLLGIQRFTEQAYTGEQGAGSSIRNGLVGDIYGMKVYVSSNCPTETAADTTTKYRVGAILHKDATALVEQQAVRSQTQYKQEYLADLFTADTVYGVGELRDNAGIAFVVPS